MGGGTDSRIPAVLNESLNSRFPEKKIEVVVRTYDFDPEKAHSQIGEWVEELTPSLIIGESLGAIQAIRVKGIPHILISPSLNAPVYFRTLAFVSLIPGVTWLLSKIYKTRTENRQLMPFKYPILKKYGRHRKAALALSPKAGGKDYFYAFFGDFDHYRKTGIVSLTSYVKYFKSNSQPKFYETYPGTHFMEEEFIHSRLIPKIIKILE